VGQDKWRSVNDVRPETLAALRRTVPTVTREQRTLARSAWAAFDRLAPLLDGAGLSERGRAVLAGREPWNPEEERWIGGVRLAPGPAPWRWDPDAETLV
jgi:hypothetical protein